MGVGAAEEYASSAEEAFPPPPQYIAQENQRKPNSHQNRGNGSNLIKESGDQASQFHNIFFDHDEGENLFSKASFTSPKKRKIDSEGFVTPATPDIPKTSNMYPGLTEAESMLSDKQQNDDDRETKDVTDGDIAVTNDFYSLPSQITSETYNPETAADDLDEQQLNHKDVVQVMKEIITKSSEAHLQWAESFGKSENFEELCPARLDKLIFQARELEENLRQQKECLKKRLFMITKTLQCSPE